MAMLAADNLDPVEEEGEEEQAGEEEGPHPVIDPKDEDDEPPHVPGTAHLWAKRPGDAVPQHGL